MLKGIFGVPPSILAAMIGMLATFFMIVVPMIQLNSFAVEGMGEMDNLNTIDMTHAIEHCLKDGKGYVQWTNGLKGKIEACGIKFGRGGVLYAELKDKEAGDISSSGSKRSSKPFHSILVSVEREGGKIHVGRLYVES